MKRAIAWLSSWVWPTLWAERTLERYPFDLPEFREHYDRLHQAGYRSRASTALGDLRTVRRSAAAIHAQSDAARSTSRL